METQDPKPDLERDRAFSALGATQFDLLVIGGGITGCGVARDAALRGFKVALVEKADFASGTSSKSSKLIHGGLRYLEHAQFRLVFEGTNERALLMRLARHLVQPLPFLVPAYKESRPGLLKLDVGLWVYDAMAGFKSFKLHRTYRGPKVLELEPGLRTEALKGAIVYYDCLTDDGRLTLENALDAKALGTVVVNYARLEKLVRDGTGRVAGAEVADLDPASRRSPASVRAKVVVNATGPWTDQLRALAGGSRLLKPTKGVHVVLDAARLPLRHAVVMLARRDHRVMFGIPWGQRTVLGTTDTFHEGTPEQVFATSDDVQYLLETANHYFPAADLGEGDVLATWAGLRPLLAPGAPDVDASDISREHHLLEEPGFVTIAGGKLTTYRRIAAEVVDAVARQLGSSAPCTTAERWLPGADGIASEEELSELREMLRLRGLSEAGARHLSNVYGVRAQRVAARAGRDGGGSPLDPELPYLMAEVDEAVDSEMARSLEDVLSRRVPLLLRGRDQGLAAATAVAERMAKKLGWDGGRTREELERYRAVVADTRRFRA
ncbi:MAG: glycerol-3-phosphate dehydrogenase/oxidase [Myxococcales bacterium]|nr:glycerol-3-phosphate dehydrogenase/oxidase [Myxococcales bacterium]